MGTKKNFLGWSGSWTTPGYTAALGTQSFNFYDNEDSITISPVVGTFSNGVDLNSFAILAIKDVTHNITPCEMSRPPFWDGAQLTVYRPVDPTVLSVRITFTIKDVLGNSSTTVGASNIAMSPIITAWTEYTPSATCVLDNFGNNNSYQAFTTLQKINTGTGLPLSPLQLKDNVVSDPDYIAPAINLIACPLVYGTGLYAPLFVTNKSLNNADSNPNNYIIITNITLACTACGTGGSALVLNIPCTIRPGQTQRFNVPANVFDTGVTVTYSVAPGGNMVTASPTRYWKTQTNGVVDDFPTGAPSPVINTSPFGNHAITVSYPNGITLFCE